jgi:DNA-binding transcriptional LysR family regulator
MDIRQLQYLVALAEERHFTRAAERCHVTQPTLSGRIRQLEQELGVPIVSRDQRFHGLTDEGERILKWARQILDNCQAMQQDLSAFKGGLGGRIILDVIPSAHPVTTAITRAVREAHPNITFTIHSRTSREILSDIHAFRADAGITYLDNEPVERVESLPLYRERYCVFLPAAHPAAERPAMTWTEAAELPLCLLTPDMQNRRIVNDAFREAGHTPVVDIEADSYTNLWSHVRSGDWATIMPAFYQEAFGCTETIRAVPLVEPAVEHEVGLVTAPREPLSPLIAALFECCRWIRTEGLKD